MEKPRLIVLADMEHEFRISRDPVWFRTAECERESHLRDARGDDRCDSHTLDRCSRYAARCPTDYRAHERPYLEPARTQAALLPDRRNPGDPRPVHHAQFPGALVRGDDAMGNGCVDQCLHGTVPRVGGRPAAVRPADDRVRGAELLYRDWSRGRFGFSVCAHQPVWDRNTAPRGEIPASVVLSFYAGGLAFIGAVGWTVYRTREYPPVDMEAFRVLR